MQKRTLSVTIIDDDETVHYIISALIRRENPDAVINSFGNALDFLAAYSDTFVANGILLDINMPKMDGWQLLDRLKQIQFRIPVYMFSSSADARDVNRVVKYEEIVKGYIVKPLTTEKLRSLLATISKNADAREPAAES